MELLGNARQLADFISSLDDFNLNFRSNTTYNHMGATLSDAILQSGLNYRNVVLPRIRRILNIYPDVTTTTEFLLIIEIYGADCVLDWNHSEKPRRLCELTSLLCKNNIESEDDLRTWLKKQSNCLTLLELKGLGPKTVDYLKRLVDIPTVAVDRHIKTFVSFAGLKQQRYEEIKIVVEFAADLLEVNRSHLDYAIWLYMASSVAENKKRQSYSTLP